MTLPPRRILFTGYARVHFVCFEPLYRALSREPAVEIYVSGGLRSAIDDGYAYDHGAMYAPFDLPPSHVLPVDQIRDEDFDVLFCANTKRILPRRIGLGVQIFHGVSFRNKAIRPENLGSDHYFLVGPYMRRNFEKRGLLAVGDRRGLSIGFPKTDRLIDGSLDRAEILARYGFRGDRPVILYAPTGGHANSLVTMGEDVLRRLRRGAEYDVLVKPHDHGHDGVDWFARLAPLEGEHLRLVRDPDVVPHLFAADLLITDASSVSNEYALLDRPIVFLDVPELIDAARAAGSLVDLETWGRRGGEIARTPTAAAAAVARALRDPSALRDLRRAMAADLFYNPGAATRAAMDWLRREIGVSAA